MFHDLLQRPGLGPNSKLLNMANNEKKIIFWEDNGSQWLFCEISHLLLDALYNESLGCKT